MRSRKNAPVMSAGSAAILINFAGSERAIRAEPRQLEGCGCSEELLRQHGLATHLPTKLHGELARPGTRVQAAALSVHFASSCPFTLHQQEPTAMDWNRVEGNWKQVKGKVKEKWGKLTDDDLNVINGRRDQLEGKIQERYGVAKDQVRQDIDDWYSAQKW